MNDDPRYERIAALVRETESRIACLEKREAQFRQDLRDLQRLNVELRAENDVLRETLTELVERGRHE